jgi:predicted DNA binding CopG/RHH family protein
MADSRRAKDYAEMNDAALNAELDAVIAERERSGRPVRKLGDWAAQLDRTVAISIRVPARLLQRLRDESSRSGVPYQRLMLRLIEAGLDTEQDGAIPPRITVPVTAEALQSGRIVLDLVSEPRAPKD